MAFNPISDLTGNPYFTVVIVAVIAVVAVAIRLYTMHKPGLMRAKCPKCGVVFDASHMFSSVHVGPYKMLTCPSCGKTSFMNAYSKEPINYPSKPQQDANPAVNDEELIRRRIEESKYEKP